MTLTVNIGKGIELPIDTDAFGLPTDMSPALAHVVYIGFRNILMDSHASITKESNPDDLTEAATAMAQKKLDALMRGEVRVQSTRTSDPFTVELNRLSMAELVKKLRKAGKKAGDYEKAALRAAADKLVTDEMRALARKNIETVIPVDESVSLSDLGL